MSFNWVEDITHLYKKFGFFTDQAFDGEFLRFRQRLLEEEIRELNEAILENNPEKVVDAHIDICVVAIGTLLLGGVGPGTAWDQVFNSNLEKKRAINPNRIGSGGFDLIKPEGWIPPNHENNLGNFPSAIREIVQFMDKTGIDRIENGPVPSHVKIMDEFRFFALSKNHDYNGDDPEFQHAKYYPDGISNIVYEISKKVKRIQRGLKRLLENGSLPKTESLYDSFRDINIYSAIAGAYMLGKLEGQSENRDIFNRELKGTEF